MHPAEVKNIVFSDRVFTLYYIDTPEAGFQCSCLFGSVVLGAAVETVPRALKTAKGNTGIKIMR